jgi:hypothetical protein
MLKARKGASHSGSWLFILIYGKIQDLVLEIFSRIFLCHLFHLVIFLSCQFWVYSFCIYETSSKASYFFLYDESVSWKGQNEIVSLLNHYISNIMCTEVCQPYFWFKRKCERIYKGVSKSFWTGHLEWELQMVLLSATRCSCITILWVILVSFAIITPCVASQWVFIVVYFVIDSVWKLLDTPSY